MMRWAGNVPYVRKKGMQAQFLWESQMERDYSDDPDIGGRIILKLT
jgi:hypothetical protein